MRTAGRGGVLGHHDWNGMTGMAYVVVLMVCDGAVVALTTIGRIIDSFLQAVSVVALLWWWLLPVDCLLVLRCV